MDSKAHPAVFFVLHLPMGIVSGFTTVLFPYLATKAGMSVAMTGSIVAAGLLAQSVRVFWAPFADMMLTLKKWCVLGALGVCALLMALAFIPANPSHAALYSGALFLLNALACVENTPVPGLLAHNISDERKGTACGCYMAGAMVGSAVSGSAGIWIAQHSNSAPLACGVLAASCLASLAGLFWVEEPPRLLGGLSLWQRFQALASGTWQLLRKPSGAYLAVLVLMPIGLGATGNFWPAIAPEWGVSADMMAFVAGAGTTVATLVGCVVGGWVSNRRDATSVFMVCSALLCAVGFALAAAPRTAIAFAAISLAYMLVIGLCNSAYGTMIYRVVGREAAAFKYQAFNSAGNVPSSYMTAFNGYVHDRSGSTVMLNVEAGLCLGLIGLFVGARKWIKT